MKAFTIVAGAMLLPMGVLAGALVVDGAIRADRDAQPDSDIIVEVADRTTSSLQRAIVEPSKTSNVSSSYSIEDSVANHLPGELPLAVVVRDGDKNLLELREWFENSELSDSPLITEALNNPGIVAAKMGLMGLAAAAKTDSWTAIASLLGSETVFSFVGEGANARFALVTKLRDEEAADRFIEQVNLAVGNIVRGKPNPNQSKVIDGKTVFALGEAFFCRMDDVLLIANRRDVIEACLAVKPAQSLARNAAFKRAFDESPADAIAWSYLDMPTVRAMAGDQGFFNAKMRNPLAGFIFGGWAHALRESDMVHASLTTTGRGLAVDLRVPTDTTLQSPWTAFENHEATLAGWSTEKLPGYLGEMIVQRDWEQLFADREELLTVVAAGQAVDFAAVLTTIMAQVDFMDDFLPMVDGPVRLVMAQQDFSRSPHNPTPKLPGFALVVPMDLTQDPDMPDLLRSSALSAITVIGLDQSQKGEPALMSKLEAYNGIQMIYGMYRDQRNRGSSDMRDSSGVGGVDEDGHINDLVAVQYNFTPAAAVVGNELVIATTRELMHSIIDAHQADGSATRTATGDSLDIDAASLQAVLRDNLDELVINRMLEEDESREQATAFYETVFGIMALLDDLQMTSHFDDSGLTERVEFNLK